MDHMDQKIPPHALIIEDDAFFSELLARNLSRRNFRVTTVEDLDAAKKYLVKGGCDVVCFDIVVSGGDGMKRLSEIKTGGFFKSTPLLLLIDKEQEPKVLLWVNEDAVAYVVKNESSPDEIASKIETLATR
ncbi:MAG: response regulator [Parcubacteria group bacterium]|nr:response regulator [Parcubacteria group bacterium]